MRPRPGSSTGAIVSSTATLAEARILRRSARFELLAHERGQTVGAASEVHGFGRHQHPYAGRHRNHVTAITARSTACRLATSMPAVTRTGAAPITISIMPEPLGTAGAIGASFIDRRSTTTGAKAGAFFCVSLSACRRACRRQPNNCCSVSPCPCATALTLSPSR